MFRLLWATESLVHPLHYSMALHFHQNISQSGQHALIAEQQRALQKERAAFDSVHVM